MYDSKLQNCAQILLPSLGQGEGLQYHPASLSRLPPNPEMPLRQSPLVLVGISVDRARSSGFWYLLYRQILYPDPANGFSTAKVTGSSWLWTDVTSFSFTNYPASCETLWNRMYEARCKKIFGGWTESSKSCWGPEAFYGVLLPFLNEKPLSSNASELHSSWVEHLPIPVAGRSSFYTQVTATKSLSQQGSTSEVPIFSVFGLIS